MAATIKIVINDQHAKAGLVGHGSVRYTLTQNGTIVGSVAETSERVLSFASYTAGANDNLVLTIEPIAG